MDWNSYGSRMNTSYDTLTLDPWQSTKFGRPMYWRKSSTNQVTLDTEIQFYQLLNYKIYTNCFSPLPPSYKSYILLISTLRWIWIHRKSAPKAEVNKIDSNRIVNTTVNITTVICTTILRCCGKRNNGKSLWVWKWINFIEFYGLYPGNIIRSKESTNIRESTVINTKWLLLLIISWKGSIW